MKEWFSPRASQRRVRVFADQLIEAQIAVLFAAFEALPEGLHTGYGGKLVRKAVTHGGLNPRFGWCASEAHQTNKKQEKCSHEKSSLWDRAHWQYTRRRVGLRR